MNTTNVSLQNNRENRKCSFIFMGVSGSGKSVIAEAIAKKLNAPFLDGDFLHPRANISKMASGCPLNDEDRKPWLESLNSAIYAMQRTHDVSILVCSALKRKYRDMLREGNKNLYFIYLKGDFDLIAQRLSNRKGHFFKPEMLKSQFEALEEPLNNHNDVCFIDINNTIDGVADDSMNFILRVLEE